MAPLPNHNLWCDLKESNFNNLFLKPHILFNFQKTRKAQYWGFCILTYTFVGIEPTSKSV